MRGRFEKLCRLRVCTKKRAFQQTRDDRKDRVAQSRGYSCLRNCSISHSVIQARPRLRLPARFSLLIVSRMIYVWLRESISRMRAGSSSKNRCRTWDSSAHPGSQIFEIFWEQVYCARSEAPCGCDATLSVSERELSRRSRRERCSQQIDPGSSRDNVY